MSLLSTLGSVGSNLLGYGGQAAAGLGTSFANGMIGNYFNRKQAQLNYEYQERVARNSPKWHVDGLRNAGLNPILAATGGSFSGGSWSPATASVQGATAPDLKLDPISRKQMELLDAEIKGQKIRNENEEKNRSLNGQWGVISRLISEYEQRAPKAISALSSFLTNKPHVVVTKKADANLESYTKEERQALQFYDILQHHGYNDVDARHEGGEEFWEHLENAWAKRRRNVRASRKR